MFNTLTVHFSVTVRHMVLSTSVLQPMPVGAGQQKCTVNFRLTVIDTIGLSYIAFNLSCENFFSVFYGTLPTVLAVAV